MFYKTTEVEAKDKVSNFHHPTHPRIRIYTPSPQPVQNIRPPSFDRSYFLHEKKNFFSLSLA